MEGRLTMLVLSRKTNERVLIGDEISVTIVRIGPNTVRIGIDAPREFDIVREELIITEQDPTPTETESKNESEEAVAEG